MPTLRGKTVVNLFYETSTRTRTSFEIAGKWLSADVINFSAAGSSADKGESLLDTAQEHRGHEPGRGRGPPLGVGRRRAARARHLRCAIVNAGDGAHEHPTQALLDLLTIREKKGHLEGLNVAIVGDIAHSRVARSNIHGMRKIGHDGDGGGAAHADPAVRARSWACKVSHRLEEAIATST